MIYLDNAATTLRKPSSVYRAVRNAMHRAGTPGRGGHRAAMEAAETVYRCRELAAELFDVPYPEQVVFTMNSTHALNIAIRSLVRPGMRVVVSGYEHNAVMRPLYALGAEIRTARGILFDQADVLSAFRRELREDTGAVVLNHVSNVFGFIQPAAEIADLCRERGIPLILDASQSAGVLPISLKRLGAAFIAMPGHKGLYGPQGTGILLCGRKPEPLLFGGTGSGSREKTMPEDTPESSEAGTHNVPGIAGLAEGIRFVRSVGTETILRHERDLLSAAAGSMEHIPGIRIWKAEDRAAQTGVLSFRYGDEDTETTAEVLGLRGFALRGGLHCAPLAHETAGTAYKGTVRMSVSAFSDRGDVLLLSRELGKIRKGTA